MSQVYPHRFNRPRVAELHRQLVDKLKTMTPPSDRPLTTPLIERAAGLRNDAFYLSELQKALEPVIEAVVDRAVTSDGIRDVSDARTFPHETLDDNLLAEFERRAEEIDEESSIPYSRRRNL